METKINEKDGAEMVWVPEGEFIMGSDDHDDDEKPRRTVYLDGYWIYKYPVTLEQYAKYCRESGLALPPKPEWGYRHNHPVVNVSWDDALAYCEWASVALPSEAEWEKAARGTDGREYPWGPEWDTLMCSNSVGGGSSSTASVTAHPSGGSPFGAMEMAGNVWEWCGDWYSNAYYNNAPKRNPIGPPKGSGRVLRGGGWNYNRPDVFRCADRYGYAPGNGYYVFGFRCVSRPGRI